MKFGGSLLGGGGSRGAGSRAAGATGVGAVAVGAAGAGAAGAGAAVVGAAAAGTGPAGASSAPSPTGATAGAGLGTRSGSGQPSLRELGREEGGRERPNGGAAVVGEAMEQGQEKGGCRQRGYAAAAATAVESPAGSREDMTPVAPILSFYRHL
jgi:hypothetical protein